MFLTVRRNQRQVLPYNKDEKGTRILTLSENRGRFFNTSYENSEDRFLLKLAGTGAGSLIQVVRAQRTGFFYSWQEQGYRFFNTG